MSYLVISQEIMVTRASIRQVAERARVSAMTVSRVLHGRKDLVKQETYARVLAVIRELDYAPVRSAVQNRHVETRAIGIVPYNVNSTLDRIDSITYEGICRHARLHGYDLLIMLRDESDWLEHRHDVRFLDRRSDGFIFNSPGIGEWHSALQALVRHNIPTVVCYRRDVPEAIPWVDPDNVEIMRQAVHCLQRHGHRRIGYLGAPISEPANAPLLYDSKARRQAFREMLGTEGVLLDFVTPEWRLQPDLPNALCTQGITGLVCVNDSMALQAWEMLAQAGLRVPEDISIVGIDDMPESAPRGLTSIAFGYENVGRLAVDAWVELLSGTPAPACCKTVPCRLEERASVATLRDVTRHE